jgi:hypothetical protein
MARRRMASIRKAEAIQGQPSEPRCISMGLLSLELWGKWQRREKKNVRLPVVGTRQQIPIHVWINIKPLTAK